MGEPTPESREAERLLQENFGDVGSLRYQLKMGADKIERLEEEVADLERRLNECALLSMDRVSLDLTEPTGWDAAVDALARHYWPDMGETERAVFFHDGTLWFLLRPFPQQTVSWRMDYRAHQPHEALRCALHQVAGRS